MRRFRILVPVLCAMAACGAGASDSASSAERFLEEFVASDGRVVRHDQGGDTVSEGQAYALLVAVAEGDEERFDRVWRWTREHLQREDGLLSWHWLDGRVADPQPAADADLDAAHALMLAAERFERPQLEREGRRIAAAVRRLETKDGRLVAGPWALSRGVVNPGYVAPAAFAALGGEWSANRQLVEQIVDGGRLPPDWARLDGTRLTPSSSPTSGEPPRYGFDAVRLPLRMAASCDPAWRALAAKLWPTLRADPGRLPRELNGEPLGGSSSAGLAGSAAAARAAGDPDAAARLLDRADALERERPTYFGSALVALARTAWSGSC